MTWREVYWTFGVTHDVLRQWVARGHVTKRGRDRYDYRSVRDHVNAREADTTDQTCATA